MLQSSHEWLQARLEIFDNPRYFLFHRALAFKAHWHHSRSNEFAVVSFMFATCLLAR